MCVPHYCFLLCWRIQFYKEPSLIHIGFTGSQHPMTQRAKITLHLTLHDIIEEHKFSSAPTCLHHGDCINSDEEAAKIGSALGYLVHAHPSFLEKKRAFSEFNDVIHAPKEPLERNKDIAKISSVLVATPHTYQEIIRSGTWTTIRRARELNREIGIIFPDGSIKWENSDRTDRREAT